ncbi:hypothetical protein PHYPSEUDO_010765 [Phytophthora pseudosyringae]|uniref:Transmembrane protein n=1 Tax=Phytophthora pseudosyringae TaxID=221518 RepID=A0A8T1VCU7_9STRA|nr:hypothetical protein PHYPSEUDO_010765 [Phytophthora pseudosyringae]
MDGGDEPAMAYFLPNGIADDSPPKQMCVSSINPRILRSLTPRIEPNIDFLLTSQPWHLFIHFSRTKASFGPIGGRSAATTTGHSAATAPGSAAAVAAASGAPNSRSDVDFTGLHARPRPTLEPSPFRSSGGSPSSPRPTNFLLSDLGGEIHTPRASRDFGDSGGRTSRSSSPFGFAGPFGSGLKDTGAIGGAGAIRSPSSMFDRGQEAARTFSMQGEGRRSVGASGAYGGSEAQQLYRGGDMSSYLSAGDVERPFGSNSMRTWPSSATDVSQPRRVLQRPPGLAGPPGLSELSAIQLHMRLGSGGGDMMQQPVSGPQFGSFHPSTSSPMEGGGPSARAFSTGDGQYGPNLLSNLRLSTGMFGTSSLRGQNDTRGVSNPDLAELNTHSVKVGEMDSVRQAVDYSPATWDNREPTTSRRIDIQAKSKIPRSPKKSRDGRRKPDGRSDLRAKALEFSMGAINAFTPGSPQKPRRSERGRKTASPVENSPSSYDSNHSSSNQPRGKSRNQGTDKDAVSSFVNAGGNDVRRRGPTNQSDESGSVLTPRSNLESSGAPAKNSLQEPSKSKRRDDTKSSSRSTSRRNSARGNDKGAGTTRRQVYREKLVKDTVKGLSLQQAATLSVASPSTSSNSPQGSQVSSDSQKPDEKPRERKEKIAQDAKSNASSRKTSEAVSGPSSSIKARADDVDEAANTAAKKATDSDDAVISDHVDDAKRSTPYEADSNPVLADTSREIAAEDPATTTERESSSSSDAPEFDQTAAQEANEGAQEAKTDSPESDDILSLVESSASDAERAQASTDPQRAASTKKSKKKVPAPVEPPTESHPLASNTEPDRSVPPESPQTAVVEKRHAARDHRKEKPKKDKADKKKTTRGKKEKRGSSVILKAADAPNDSAAEVQDKLLEALATKSTPLSGRINQGLRKGGSALASAGLLAFLGTRRGCIWLAGRLNIKGLLASTFSYVESALAVVFSVVLLFSLHAASWFIRIHRVAFRAILTHRHIGFCFAFLYGFPFLVQYVFPWAPPWAPVCLWYAFLVQLFCTNGPTAMVTTFRVILPLVFLVEGISHHSFLLDLNGAELLLTSFIISALKTSNLCSPIFFLSLATQCLLAVFLGSELLVQWLQLALALYSLHVMAATDDEWIGMGDEEDDLSCHPMSMHHSIADYNHHPAPSSAVSIQKTKRLDRRALAYVRGRKLR